MTALLPNLWNGEKWVLDSNKKIQTKAVRTGSKGSSKTVIDSARQFFMDVGGWQIDARGKATTDFALVSERDILLCSWMNLRNEGIPIADLQTKTGNRFPLAAPISDFLWEASKIGNVHSDVAPTYMKRALEPGGRGFITRWGRTVEPITREGYMLLVLGDLHLHLFPNTPVDRFRYRRASTSEVVPLDQELRVLLDHANVIQDEKGHSYP